MPLSEEVFNFRIWKNLDTGHGIIIEMFSTFFTIDKIVRIEIDSSCTRLKLFSHRDTASVLERGHLITERHPESNITIDLLAYDIGVPVNV